MSYNCKSGFMLFLRFFLMKICYFSLLLDLYKYNSKKLCSYELKYTSYWIYSNVRVQRYLFVFVSAWFVDKTYLRCNVVLRGRKVFVIDFFLYFCSMWIWYIKSYSLIINRTCICKVYQSYFISHNNFFK